MKSFEWCDAELASYQLSDRDCYVTDVLVWQLRTY